MPQRPGAAQKMPVAPAGLVLPRAISASRAAAGQPYCFNDCSDVVLGVPETAPLSRACVVVCSSHAPTTTPRINATIPKIARLTSDAGRNDRGMPAELPTDAESDIEFPPWRAGALCPRTNHCQQIIISQALRQGNTPATAVFVAERGCKVSIPTTSRVIDGRQQAPPRSPTC